MSAILNLPNVNEELLTTHDLTWEQDCTIKSIVSEIEWSSQG